MRSDGHSGTTWSPRGQTPIVMTTGQRFGLNMLSAVSAKGLLRFMVVTGRVGGEQVCEFMRRLMYRAKRPVFPILDGHPMHKSRLVKQCEQSYGGKLKLSCRPIARTQPRCTGLARSEIRWDWAQRNLESRRLGAKALAHLEALKGLPKKLRSFFQLPMTRYAAQ